MKVNTKHNSSKRSKKNKISFDEEVVSKDQAEKLLSKQSINSIPKKQILEKNDDSEFKGKAKNKKRKPLNEGSKGIEKTKTKKTQSLDDQTVESKIDVTAESLVETENTQDSETTKQPKKESNRSQKRKKHANLMEQKKLKTELDLQGKALNYLSKWKHSRSEWKFEKLKQVWIQQNLFDSSKIPEEFWETAVEYFSGAKGHSRQVAFDEAIKIIEKKEESTEESLDEDCPVKLKRARDIVQNLQ